MNKTERVMTDVQLDVYKYISDYILDNGFSPSIRDIALELNIPLATANWRLKSIQKKGWVNYVPTISRSLSIPNDYFLWYEKEILDDN